MPISEHFLQTHRQDGYTRERIFQEGSGCSWKELNTVCAHSLTLGPLTSLVTSASNISGFGMSQKVGHLDFYPNGGKQMPGCQKNALSTIVDINGLWEGT